jgi:NADPH:quinone reductase-like Zn-dependent oxidoreductase
MSQTGRAIVIRKNGGTEVLESVTDYPFPAAGDEEVLIHTVSSSVNPVDIYIRKGLFGPLAESPTVRFTPFPELRIS